MNKGVYVHVPFCVRKCPYCDFYSAPADEDARHAYALAVIHAIETAPWDFAADTLYLGGGTPSLLSGADLLAIRKAVEKRFGLTDAECTVEANPGTVTPAQLSALADGGFTRISFGVQALDDGLLRALGRIHTAKEALSAIDAAEKAGFRHISADLMLAVPGQTEQHIFDAVRRLSETAIDHLSAYLLQIEEGTPFFGAVPPPDEDFAADCYRAAAEACEAHGFSQYEISNFARGAAAQSRHNLHYWHGDEYLGIGPAAHSFLDGKRFFFPRDRDAFVSAENPWLLAVPDGDGGGEEERILLGLRLTEGISPADFSENTAARLQKRAQPLIAAGLMRRRGGRLALTREGFLVSNTIIASLL